ncbi:hypothetical protein FAZ97_26380 [Paraburkholderia acidiphila]|uniref:MmgE/PrpD N-terminal domain-containing protein n=1 Tax=Paraburkholderia acidiphila TaxID=2571747 RepID=A0A7Z2GB71_9BURK|nr:hypothetical protein FAZ97_26380 [Paraburkholderia acidiphila]
MQRRAFMASLTALAAGAGTFGGMGAARAQKVASAPASPTIAQRLAAYAAALSYDDLDANTIEAVKTHTADALGCGIAALGEKPVGIARQVALNYASGDGRGARPFAPVRAPRRARLKNAKGSISLSRAAPKALPDRGRVRERAIVRHGSGRRGAASTAPRARLRPRPARRRSARYAFPGDSSRRSHNCA